MNAPASVSSVIQAIDRATAEDLKRYLAVVAGYQSMPLEPGDELRRTRALAIWQRLQLDGVTAFAVQFLREHAETIAQQGGF